MRSEGWAGIDGKLPAVFLYEGMRSGAGQKVDWPRAAAIAKRGNMILAGQTLFVLEVEPAAYAALAANEAEKAADINILEVRAVGSFGRVYIGGEEKDVVVAHEAATQAIEAVTGTRKKS